MATLVWQWRGRFTVALLGLIALVVRCRGQTPLPRQLPAIRARCRGNRRHQSGPEHRRNDDHGRSAAVDIGGGVIAQVLTFNGTVPGPHFRLQVGNEVIVHFTNNIAHATGIHWHGIELHNASDGTPLTQNHGRTWRYVSLQVQGDAAGHVLVSPAPPLLHQPGVQGHVRADHRRPIPTRPRCIGRRPVRPPHTLTMVLSDLTVCKPAGTNDATTYQLTLPHVSGSLSAQQPPFPVDALRDRAHRRRRESARPIRRRRGPEHPEGRNRPARSTKGRSSSPTA